MDEAGEGGDGTGGDGTGGDGTAGDGSGGDGSGGDAGVAEQLAELLDVDADTALVLRPPTGQVRRWEFKVLGTGRAIAVSTPWGE